MCDTIAGFQAALTKTFDPVSASREKAHELSTLKQGKDSVCDYTIHFRTLATESGWNNTALYNIFLKGLSPDIQDLLVPLDTLIALAIRTDNRWSQLKRQREPKQGVRGGAISAPDPRWRTSPSTTLEKPPSRPPAHEEEPMQLGRPCQLLSY